MRTLSKGSLTSALALPLLLLVTLSVIEIVNEPLFTIQGFNFGLVLFGAFVLWIWIATAATYDVLYDSEFVYLRGMLTNNRVPLASVTNIYLASSKTTQTGRVYQYYIVRFNHSAIAHRRIKQRKGEEKMKMFAAAVKRVNGDVVIEDKL